jgi:hypothetical protein
MPRIRKMITNIAAHCSGRLLEGLCRDDVGHYLGTATANANAPFTTLLFRLHLLPTNTLVLAINLCVWCTPQYRLGHVY